MSIDWKSVIAGFLLGYFFTAILNKFHGLTSKAS